MDAEALRSFIARHERLFVLTGAGCSTASGIPDYRDEDGGWKRSSRPVMFQAFVGDAATRSRYWARSLVGWSRIRHARPNAAHRALASLEQSGRVELLVTQNVDGLHQAAGNRSVIDLHGRLSLVRCLGCERRSPRDALQERLLALNPDWPHQPQHAWHTTAPDGDADLHNVDFTRFRVPDCTVCGGLLKPDVVFFGENVPRQRVHDAMAALARADGMLIVGSSLTVYSGYRFAVAAAEAAKPIAAVNLGRTRADALLTLKLTQRCTDALAFLATASISAASQALPAAG
jgi:NAD-dependent SIR2 family protein deacetylase